MIRTLLLLSVINTVAFFPKAFGQQHDQYWIGGNWSFELKEVLMRFDQDTITYQLIDMPEKMMLEKGSLAMSDANGELQFYSNGNAVASWNHHIMQGGKGFNKGSSNDDFGVDGKDTFYNVSYYPYNYQFIPDPYDAHVYYMIHAFITEMGDCKRFYAPRMQISKIDMSANGGKGKVLYKNRYFGDGLMGAGFALVRHGNGRDWWVVQHKQDGLAYKSTLLHRDTVVQEVHSPLSGLSSDWFSCDDWALTNGNLLYASLDGTRIVDLYGRANAKLLAFDRCSGEVSLLDTFGTGITMLQIGSTLDSCSTYSYEFSPSGRYLYGAGLAEFSQWDLEAADIGASKVKLCGPPWQMDDFQNVLEGIPGGFSVFATGPDGKIYNLIRTMHSVIEHPDKKGAACGLCLASDNPPSCLGDNVPYWLYSGRHPNYRLGPLEGSACDSITSGVQQPPDSGYGVSVSPSAAAIQAQVEITLPNYGGSSAEITVVDMLGRVVYRHRFAPFAYLHDLEVQGWAPGVYNIVLSDKGGWKAVARLVVVR